MDKDTKDMLKKVLIYDCIILALALIISMMIFEKYALIIIIGLVMAELNFFLNAVITSYNLRTTGNAAIYVLGAMVRISITVAVAIVLAESNMMNLAAFLIGYTLHYLAVLFYGVARGKNKEGK